MFSIKVGGGLVVAVIGGVCEGLMVEMRRMVNVNVVNIRRWKNSIRLNQNNDQHCIYDNKNITYTMKEKKTISTLSII